jgi:hypothetical protein
VTESIDHPVQAVVLALMVLGVVAAYVALFQLWQPRTVASTRAAWALGAAGMLVILLGGVAL